ncbi:hypothetical protein PIB30_037082 [Stylosanthes scabra]|uniref:Protein phosphatase n=1 Tax=Stylosanthes scabra TaxID=79078 RepID=A0ABU6XD82_9FABA|nr:hypothetical protein [Stylosanthes scabra]
MADLFSRSFQCLLVPSRNLPQKSSERLRISAPIPLPKRSLRVTQHTHVLANSTSASSSSSNSVPEDVDILSSTVDKGDGVDRAINSATDGIAADTDEPITVSSSLELEQVADNKEITLEIVDVDRAANSLTGGIDMDADSSELIPVSTLLEPEQVADDEERTHLIVDVDREENSLAAGVDYMISELMPVSTSLEPEQVVDGEEEMANNVVDVDKAANSLTAGVHSDNVDGDKAEISLTAGVDSNIGELVAVSSESAQIAVDEETTNHIMEEPFDESKRENLFTLHDSVATPDLENKTDVGNMERNDYEKPSLPTVPESYVETASHGGKSLTTQLCLISGAACLPHPSKASTGREDAYLISHPNWLGVADGVGDWSLQGNNAGYYIRELMEKCENIVSNRGNLSTMKPAEVITGGAAKTQNSGSSAILVAHFDGQAFHAANVGNTGFMVIRDGCIFKKSSPMFHEFSFPLQIVTGEDPSEIIEGYKVDVNDGDVIITATNGLFDNLYDQEIASVVSKSLQANLKPQEIAKLLAMRAQEVGRSSFARSPFGDAAQAAGYVGYTGGKLDNVTVIVSLVKTT